jgi:hypothetical protein
MLHATCFLGKSPVEERTMSLNAKNPSWARPLPQRLRSVVVAAGLQLVAMSAFAISGSGTFTITSPSSVPSGSVTETVSGAYTTPLGDTGSFTLTRDSSTGYITAAGGSPTGPSFETGANGITARNSVCESVKHSTLTYCKDSPDKFVYTLTLSPAPNSGPLTIEVVQGSSPVGNSEVATIQFEYAPGASGVLAANPAVKLHSQNPSNVADTSTPQIRTFDSNTPTLDKASPLPGANTALSAPTSIFFGRQGSVSGGLQRQYQCFGHDLRRLPLPVRLCQRNHRQGHLHRQHEGR